MSDEELRSKLRAGFEVGRNPRAERVIEAVDRLEATRTRAITRLLAP
jgi:hypothetical protein